MYRQFAKTYILRCSLKKKGLQFNFISDFPISLPKSGCSLKKKKGLHFDFNSLHPISIPKSGSTHFSSGISSAKFQ